MPCKSLQQSKGLENTVSNKGCDVHLHGIAFTGLVTFMEDLQKGDIAPIVKLTDLVFMCKTRLEQFGADVEGWIYTSRLKERCLSVLPDLLAHSQGKCIILTFDEDIPYSAKLWRRKSLANLVNLEQFAKVLPIQI